MVECANWIEQTKIKQPNTKTKTNGANRKLAVGFVFSFGKFDMRFNDFFIGKFRLYRQIATVFWIIAHCTGVVSSAAVKHLHGSPSPLMIHETVATSSAETADAELPQSFRM